MPDDFSSSRLDILVAPDIAAYGLHIPAVTHIFNDDWPDDYQDYVHYIGRTGRMSASGHALPVNQYNSEALLRHLPAPKKIHRFFC